MVATPDPYYDLVLKSTDGKEVKWRELDCQYKMGALISVATGSVDHGYKLLLDIPLKEITINYLIEWGEKKKGPELSWINLEHILLEIESMLPKVKEAEAKALIECKETIIGMFMDKLWINNCIGIWRMCVKLNSRYLDKALLFVMDNLYDGVQEKTIDNDFYRLEMSQLAYLLSHDKLRIQEENHIVSLAWAWISMHQPSRKPYLKELLSTVRAEGLSHTCTQLAGFHLSELSLSNARSRGTSATIVIGGWEATPRNDMLLFDHVNDRWIRMNNRLPEVIAYHGAVLLNRDLYLFGGGDDGTRYYDTAWKMSPTGVWHQLSPMKQRRCYITHSVCVLNDCVWVMGGHNGRHRLRTVERFNPARGSWEDMPQMLRPRSDGAAAVINEKIYILGGFDGRSVQSATEVFDPRTGVWSEFVEMPAQRTGMCCIAQGTTIIAIGGFDGLERHKTVWSIDTAHPENGWKVMPSLNHARANSSVCWHGKKILVAGGYNNVKLRKVELFDGSSWNEAPDLPAGRSALQMISISHEDATRLMENAEH